jgi:DNA topoisomerase VI subunit B
MTGQAVHRFADVVVKELMDNALDACETLGVAPEVTLGVGEYPSGGVVITVTDNGGGIPEKTVHDALNFDVFVSDKAAYRSPTRGAQGNALKTVFGIPLALGSHNPVIVEANGTQHEARVWKDPAGQLRIQCDDTDIDEPTAGKAPLGTSVSAWVPTRGTGRTIGIMGSAFLNGFDSEFWARAFALFNPHATVKIARFEEGNHMVNPGCPFSKNLTSRPARARGLSTSPPTRPARTGTTRRPSSASSSATSATTVTMVARTSASAIS